MKYKIKREALLGLVITILLFTFRATVVVTGDQNTEIEDMVNAQFVINLFVDSIATILALSISLIQSAQNYKKNKIAFCCDVASLVCCALCLLSWPAIKLWQEYGTYVGLFFILLGLSIAPEHDVNSKADDEDIHKQIGKWVAVVLAGVMIGMALISFLKGAPQYSVSNGIVYLFVLVIILLVWDSVESFSLGNLVTLKLKIKDKEKENESLAAENKELRNQVLSVIKNNQSVTVQVNASEDKVEHAIRDDSQSEENDLMFGLIDTVVEVDSAECIAGMVEQKALEKFAVKNNIALEAMQHDVKFSQQFIDRDPLMIRDVIFDGYVKRLLDELFVEVVFQQNWRIAADVAYFRLAQIDRYAKANKTNAKMVIIIPKLTPDGLTVLFGRATKSPERLKNHISNVYGPAIK